MLKRNFFIIGGLLLYLLYSHNERRWLRRLKELPDTIELKEKYNKDRDLFQEK